MWHEFLTLPVLAGAGIVALCVLGLLVLGVVLYEVWGIYQAEPGALWPDGRDDRRPPQ